MLVYYLHGRRVSVDFSQPAELVRNFVGVESITEEDIARIERESHAFWPQFLVNHFEQRNIPLERPVHSIANFWATRIAPPPRPIVDCRTVALEMSQFPPCFEGITIFGINSFITNAFEPIEVHILCQKTEKTV